MAPFELVKEKEHPYFRTSAATHGHLLPTSLRIPPYSAAVVPFRWMLREHADEFRQEHNLVLDENDEPKLSFGTAWWQAKSNQEQLLDAFAQSIVPEKSLCFFYAKEIPNVEDPRRVLIGVGRVKYVGGLVQYPMRGNGLESLLWERMVQHSIRPDFDDGFIMPYRQIFDYLEENPDFDILPLIAFAPSEKFVQFSYGSEHVDHDGAIDSLLSLASALQRIKEYIRGPWEKCLRWIDARLTEAWQMRGPYPGLGAALSAFGLELGCLIAKEIEDRIDPRENPWDIVDLMFEDPGAVLPHQLQGQVSGLLRRAWQQLLPERRELLELLSRFALSSEQAKLIYVKEERARRGLELSDEEILSNPYVIYEATRLSAVPIDLWTLDKGMLPETSIGMEFPLPAKSAVSSGMDERRVRAITVHFLEKAADIGHTLLPQETLITITRDLNIQPPCEVTADTMMVAEQFFPGEIELVETDGGKRAYQLTRLADMGKLIRDTVTKRIRGKRLPVSANWRLLLDQELANIAVTDPELEELARTEKAAILEEVAQSRISVLIGPAGTGKTTLLSVLGRHDEISRGGILLLAPTGKARVQMQRNAEEGRAYTVAQFLTATGRYDGSTYRYRTIGKVGEHRAETVIVDECSMLTEEMLAALFESLKGVKRWILVGDPKQLPPIGPGRPFVDIVNQLAPENVDSIFPRVGPGYGELTVRLRQGGQDRGDVRLAEWYSGRPVDPGEDEFFDAAVMERDSEHLRFVQWDSAEELDSLIKQILSEELEIDSSETFEISLGGQLVKGHVYSNRGTAGKCAENWQVLSPVRNGAWGVAELNRLLHLSFRTDAINFALRSRRRMIPKPLGPEQIVYGDKVINTRNHRKYGYKVYPREGALEFIANGEIGMAVGQFRTPKMRQPPSTLQVEFSSQPGFQYSFSAADFNDEGDSLLELAYALTVHKAQGSEFGTVLLILPSHCRLLSPELLYTALTRQKKKIIILHQGQRSELMRYTLAQHSEIARRYTNLFRAPSMHEIEGAVLETRLIHRTSRGDPVRSKSEVIIADQLFHAGIRDYEYERPLSLGGKTRYPDFTVEDDDSGEVYYWEHCGMLHDQSYRQRWEEKLAWYESHGILPHSKDGNLIITRDDARGGIDSQEIKEIVQLVFG
jgi:ATP-dependent exoDNAse (exonuclease V) alpha subunit